MNHFFLHLRHFECVELKCDFLLGGKEIFMKIITEIILGHLNAAYDLIGECCLVIQRKLMLYQTNHQRK